MFAPRKYVVVRPAPNEEVIMTITQEQGNVAYGTIVSVEHHCRKCEACVAVENSEIYWETSPHLWGDHDAEARA